MLIELPGDLIELPGDHIELPGDPLRKTTEPAGEIGALVAALEKAWLPNESFSPEGVERVLE